MLLLEYWYAELKAISRNCRVNIELMNIEVPEEHNVITKMSVILFARYLNCKIITQLCSYTFQILYFGIIMQISNACI